MRENWNGVSDELRLQGYTRIQEERTKAGKEIRGRCWGMSVKPCPGIGNRCLRTSGPQETIILRGPPRGAIRRRARTSPSCWGIRVSTQSSWWRSPSLFPRPRTG